jgi:hypothetical protein
MTFDPQIREQISRYLTGTIDAADLETWLSAVTWDIDEEPQATRQLAFDALRLTSEAANGDWTETELRDQLRGLIQTVHLDSTTLLVSEQFLGRLSAAEMGAQGDAEGDPVVALMSYARYAAPMAGWFGSGRPNDRGFLHQPTVEKETRSPAPVELEIS